MNLIIFVIAFVLIAFEASNGEPERFGGFVPWASKSRRPSSPNLGNLACYDCVNPEGRKFLRPMLSNRTYKYCVLFETSDSFFLFGYPFANVRLDQTFERNPNVTKLTFNETDFLEFRPDVKHKATLCNDSDGCNDQYLFMIDSM